MASVAKQSPSFIRADETYTQQEFCTRLGMGRKAFVAARRRGLPVRKLSRRLVIVGGEAVEWLKAQPSKT